MQGARQSTESRGGGAWLVLDLKMRGDSGVGRVTAVGARRGSSASHCAGRASLGPGPCQPGLDT